MPGGDPWVANKSPWAAWTTVKHVKETLEEVFLTLLNSVDLAIYPRPDSLFDFEDEGMRTGGPVAPDAQTRVAAQGAFWWGLFKQKADVDGSLRGLGRIDSGEERAADRRKKGLGTMSLRCGAKGIRELAQASCRTTRHKYASYLCNTMASVPMGRRNGAKSRLDPAPSSGWQGSLLIWGMKGKGSKPSGEENNSSLQLDASLLSPQ
ncbi:hypothetical protein NQZ68_028754 [Dissostichus eleginoides]|nr:hypothetical protein NQZ68_028754 [Dissostichus eleginoides]